MSTKTGFAPANAILEAEATKVKQGTITSSPGLAPAARRSKTSASVPLPTAMATAAEVYRRIAD